MRIVSFIMCTHTSWTDCALDRDGESEIKTAREREGESEEAGKGRERGEGQLLSVPFVNPSGAHALPLGADCQHQYI